MATTKTKPVSEERKQTVTLFQDEAYWASLAAKLTGQTIPVLMSNLVREQLRRLLRSSDVDPDKAWSDRQRARQ